MVTFIFLQGFTVALRSIQVFSGIAVLTISGEQVCQWLPAVSNRHRPVSVEQLF